MKAERKSGAIDHTGSTLDSLLEEQGIREEVEAVAVKRVISWKLAEAMKKKKTTKQALANELKTSRSQLECRRFSGHNHSRCQGAGKEAYCSDR